MATTGEELFVRTLDVIKPGDCMRLVRGTFPNAGAEGEVTVDIVHILPYMHVFDMGLPKDLRRPEEHAPYPNPIGTDVAEADVTLARNLGKFAFDYEDPWFRHGKLVASIGGQAVDVILLGYSDNLHAELHFVAKPQPNI